MFFNSLFLSACLRLLYGALIFFFFTVKAFSGKEPGIFVAGAIAAKEEIAYIEGMALSDVVALARPQKEADLTQVRIKRALNVMGAPQLIIVPYQWGIKKGAPENPLVWPGDQVLFPYVETLINASKSKVPCSAQDKICARNQICIKVLEDPSYNKMYQVDLKGQVALRFLSPIFVEGLSLEKAAIKIKEALEMWKILPLATVKVSFFETEESLPTVRFRGAIDKPGEALYTKGMKLKDIIPLAIHSEKFDFQYVQIQRKGQSVIEMDGLERMDHLLEPGDEIVFFPIQKTEEIYVFGGVQKPGAIPFKRGLTLRSSIGIAGGYTSRGLAERVTLQRAGEAELVLNLTDTEDDIDLQSGDRVLVAQSEELRFVHIGGGVAGPGGYEYRHGMSIGDLIALAGGLRKKAKLSQMRLERLNKEEGSLEVKKNFHLGERLLPGDRVYVPRQKTILSKVQLFSL